jgi:hypothetical protein
MHTHHPFWYIHIHISKYANEKHKITPSMFSKHGHAVYGLLFMERSIIHRYIYIYSYIYIFIYIHMSMLCPCIWNHSFNHTTHVVKRLSSLRTSPVSLSSRQPWWQRLRPWFANVSRCFLEYSGTWLLIPILIPIYIYIYMHSIWIYLGMSEHVVYPEPTLLIGTQTCDPPVSWGVISVKVQ